MYLPKSKYKPPKYTQGDKLQYSDNKVYVGWYFETYQKKFFTGKLPSTDSEELFLIQAEEPKVPRFLPDEIGPSLDDYDKKHFTRYILSDTRNGTIIEVNKIKFDYFRKFTYITSIELKWDLNTPVKNVVVNGYEYKGSAYKNEQAVLEVKKQIPDIENIITDYSEFIIE